jgi:hypothetical protein
MGFRGVIIAAASLFSSIVSGYLAVYLLAPAVGQWASSLSQQVVVERALASSIIPLNFVAMFNLMQPNSWLGLACVVCTIILLGTFMKTLKTLADAE